ncbi:MAG: sugar ABC transporter permease, partial [Caldanaerobacter sp.]
MKRYIPFLLCLPSLFYLIVFIGYPLVQAFVLAFSKPKLGFTLENFISVISSQGFREAFFNTLLISGIVIPLQLAFALSLAIFVNKRFKGYMF